MPKYRTLSISARLRLHTHLKEKIENNTHRTSCFGVLRVYVKMEEDIRNIDSSGLDMLLPSTVQENIDNKFELLSQLADVTNKVQKRDIAIAEVRIIFDNVLENYPETESQLASNAKIVAFGIFESAFDKIQQNSLLDMNMDEKQ